jgi:hypothetical protein
VCNFIKEKYNIFPHLILGDPFVKLIPLLRLREVNAVGAIAQRPVQIDYDPF